MTSLRAWRLREPVSQRRYTVVKLESRGGTAGYGEGGAAVGTDVAQAKDGGGRQARDRRGIHPAPPGWFSRRWKPR